MNENINPVTNIRYGVIDANKIPILMETMIERGTALKYKAHIDDCVARMTKLLEKMGQSNAEERAHAIVNSPEWDALVIEEEEYLFTDDEGNRFLLNWLGGAPLIWCLETNELTYVNRLCSPCVPNAGDLNSGFDPHGIKCYGVPARYIGNT